MLSVELAPPPPLQNEDRFARVTISVPSEYLELIDKAAAEANETRSNYLAQSALLRMGQAPRTLTPADLVAISELLKGKR